MIYLSGCVSSAVLEKINQHPDDMGYMLTPNIPNRVDVAGFLDGRHWSIDTGMYSPSGARDFDLDRYLAWLESRRPWHSTLLFATAPDVVGHAGPTLKIALPVLPKLRERGVKAALVAQDGLTIATTPWDEFDCLFLGGGWTETLEHSHELIQEAKRRGKWVHCGRVNSKKRLLWCAQHGADSADGTCFKFGIAVNFPRIRAVLDQVNGT